MARSTAKAFVPYDRPVRVAILGLGRIYDLNRLAYINNTDAEVVALVDPSDQRRAQRSGDWPSASLFASLEDLIESGLEVDAVEVLLPIALHEEGVLTCLDQGWHVNLQKPISTDLASASRMVEKAKSVGRLFRVMENYLFYEPLQRLKDVVDSGELGAISGYHLKMVASGRGGWDVPGDTYQWQFDLSKRGRGILVFDDGWHKF